MEGETIAMTVENVTASVANLLETAVSAIGGNPILATFLGLSLVGAAAGLFAKLKRSAR